MAPGDQASVPNVLVYAFSDKINKQYIFNTKEVGRSAKYKYNRSA